MSETSDVVALASATLGAAMDEFVVRGNLGLAGVVDIVVEALLLIHEEQSVLPIVRDMLDKLRACVRVECAQFSKYDAAQSRRQFVANEMDHLIQRVEQVLDVEKNL